MIELSDGDLRVKIPKADSPFKAEALCCKIIYDQINNAEK